MHRKPKASPTSLSTRRSRGLCAPQVQVLDGTTASLMDARVVPLRERLALAREHYAGQIRQELSSVFTGCSTWVDSFWRD
jgi:hypothetical protein